MKKVLFVAHVDSHIRHFHIPYLKFFKEKGYEVHVATSNDENEVFPYCDVKHTISFERSPLKLNNIKAIKQIKQLLRVENFDLIHCHTPMGGAVTRFAFNKSRSSGTIIMYTAHGFHFCKGAPIQNWLIYYPIEKYLSKRTDILVTINHEDYCLAKKKFYAKRIEMIHGIGVDDKKFNEEPLAEDTIKKYKSEFKISDNDFVIMYVAELNKNKNQLMLIEAMNEIIKSNGSCKLLLIGKGDLYDYYNDKINKLKLQENIKLLGYRSDVNQLLKLADLYVATSKREGLPVNLVEAALSGVPLLAKKNRGHNEIVNDGVNGFLFDTQNELMELILKLQNDKKLLLDLKENARDSVKRFILDNAYSEQIKIYEDVL